MARRLRIALPLVALVPIAVLLAACGSEGISSSVTPPYKAGAVLFSQRCGGCHTLSPAGTQGTSVNKKDRERTDGPNLDKRHESVPCVLYAIRNGGFSGAIMPQNVVTGAQAQQVAAFVAKYAGQQAKIPPVCGGGGGTGPAGGGAGG
ncbi:MAG TPA: c-type cytochrome [Solirubrobacteraceae bacterium]|nr:c-type cytochrome [Solirubrobacteraceae bacterium]